MLKLQQQHTHTHALLSTHAYTHLVSNGDKALGRTGGSVLSRWDSVRGPERVSGKHHCVVSLESSLNDAVRTGVDKLSDLRNTLGSRM